MNMSCPKRLIIRHTPRSGKTICRRRIHILVILLTTVAIYLTTCFVTLTIIQLPSQVFNAENSTYLSVVPVVNISLRVRTLVANLTAVNPVVPLLDNSIVNLEGSSVDVVRGNSATEIKEKNCFYRVWRGTEGSKADDTNVTKAPDGSKVIEINDLNCNKFITLNSAMGRTGNHMFQVAALLATAYRYNLKPVLSKNFPLRRWFQLPELVNVKGTNSLKFSVQKCAVYNQDIEHLNVTTNLTLDGFFQSWKYFANAAQIVRSAYKLKERYVTEAKGFLNKVSRPGFQNVCIHVRRGDMTGRNLNQKGYVAADKAFFPKAMDFYKSKFENVMFVVLSDGMGWCKQHIAGENITYSPFNELASDLALMTLCNHVIVTSGTFGWWGAWLSRGTTVYFSGFPANGTWLDRNTNRKDYYPENWIGLA